MAVFPPRLRCLRCEHDFVGTGEPGKLIRCPVCNDADKLIRLDTVDRPALLQEREKTHGNFMTNAIVSQRLKQQLKMIHPHYENLSLSHRECLDMICLKLSRIMSGQATFKDHWDDIAGYAKLGSEACDD